VGELPEREEELLALGRARSGGECEKAEVAREKC
jgi:hypothetical protein